MDDDDSHRKNTGEPNAVSSKKFPRISLELGPMAHGGHCVARHEGRVVFVRHGIPGEIATVALTEAEEKSRFFRGDVVAVQRASEHRRAHFWAASDSLKSYSSEQQPVGGAEFGHIQLIHQRRIKTQVFRDTLQRIGKISTEAVIEEVPGEEPQGLGWRSRTSFAVTSTGVMGMYPHRTNHITPVRAFPLAHPAINDLKLWNLPLRGMQRIHTAHSNTGESLVIFEWLQRLTKTTTESVLQEIDRRAEKLYPLLEKHSGIDVAMLMVTDPKQPTRRQLLSLTDQTALTQKATINGKEFTWQVSADGFWQIHRNAPETLGQAAMDMLKPQPGEKIADLYAGAGLFTAPISEAVEENGRVDSVEASPITSADASVNFSTAGNVNVVREMVEKYLKKMPTDWDAILLDPPRAGAGLKVIEKFNSSSAQRICYVSCDPASFARDAAQLIDLGWQLKELRAFDLYPNTHHMESVALFVRP